MNIRYTPALSATPVSVQFQRALLKALPERCRELTQVLREISHKDLITVFPLLVEHVFGFGHQSGWGLVTLDRNMKLQDFDSAFQFLSPDGPLLLMAYRLLGDGHSHYEFPVSCLPLNSQRLLEEGDIPPLYSNKVPYCGPGRPVTHVLLNPFEYYIFHFAYCILNPNHPKMSAYASNELSGCLFAILLEAYLSHFLPLSGTPASSSSVVGQQTNFRSPARYASLPVNLSPFPSNQHQMSCMFGSSPTSPISAGGLLKRFPKVSTASSVPTTVTVQEELWQSEFLVQALIEFWLGLSPNSEPNYFSTLFQGIFVPSSLQMQLVRLMIKHVHMFSNSGVKNDNLHDVSISGHLSSWDAFKSQIIPQLLQKKLYTFFRLTFERWPLDFSFKLPLETWLSYIQPWRYVENKNKGLTYYKEQQPKAVGYQWQKFVTENLLFYSVLFQQLLPRFFRMELNSPKNSFLLYRITKVFSQTNLQQMISEVESWLQETCTSQLLTSNQFLSLTSVNQLRQFVVEMEGYNYHYVPMFGMQVKETASKLLQLALSAHQMAATHVAELEGNQPGFLHSILNWMFSHEECQGGLSLTESQRVTLHLDFVVAKLCQLFQLTMADQDITPTKDISVKSDSSFSKSSEFKEKLRPKSIKDLSYMGNPDLQPIRSFEVGFLVRMFHHISTTLNEKYQNEINSVYMRPDWLGRLSRQFLRSPALCHNELQQEVALPPRLCLRVLANKELLLYLVSFYALLYLAGGCGLFSYLLVLALIMLIYASVKASLEHRRTR